MIPGVPGSFSLSPRPVETSSQRPHQPPQKAPKIWCTVDSPSTASYLTHFRLSSLNKTPKSDPPTYLLSLNGANLSVPENQATTIVSFSISQAFAMPNLPRRWRRFQMAIRSTSSALLKRSSEVDCSRSPSSIGRSGDSGRLHRMAKKPKFYAVVKGR